MTSLPKEWLALLGVSYTLGLKHGMDPDHHPIIDGITRAKAAQNERLARWTGFLFSVGHGCVVILVAIGISLISRNWQAPEWLDSIGAGISIGFLYALGILNLYNVFTSSAEQMVAAVGLKSWLLRGLVQVSHLALIVAVGALFALSFDTLSLVALLSFAASNISGLSYSVVLGGAFTFGMMTTDGINGFWVAKMLARADRRALIASRIMGLAIGGLSMLVGSYGLAQVLFPVISVNSQNSQLVLGCAAVAVIGLSFLVGLRLARPTISDGVKVPDKLMR